MPKNYYPDDDGKTPLISEATANNLYTNWLNYYYVYQATPCDCNRNTGFSLILGDFTKMHIHISSRNLLYFITKMAYRWRTKSYVIRSFVLILQTKNRKKMGMPIKIFPETISIFFVNIKN